MIPFDNYRLTTDNCGRTVSNEIQEEKAKILYEKGSLLMIMIQRFEINDVLRKKKHLHITNLEI